MDVKRVLYLSYDGMTDPLGQSQVLPYLLGLSKRGYAFTLVSFEKPGRFEEGKNVIENICEENGIEWHPLVYTKSPPVFSTLKDIRTLKNKIKALHSARAFHLVHCRSYITSLAGMWMKNKWGVKFIFDMRGFWADERTDGGLWNLKNPLYKIVYSYFKKKEREFLQNADYTVSLTENARTEIRSWDTANTFSEIEVIPCCVDLELFDPRKVSCTQVDLVRQQLQISPGQKVISYVGSIGTWYLLEEMLDFFRQFLIEFPGSIFLFISKDDKEAIMEVVQKKSIPREAVRIKAAERNEMPLLISMSDYSIFFIKPAFSKKASSPTKQGELMAMGVPVICNHKVGDTSFVVDTYNSGIVIEKFSGSAYQKSLKQLVNMDFNKEAIRKGAEAYFSLENGIEKYNSIYEKILR